MDDEILKKALEAELSDQYRELMDTDIPEYQFSEGFLKEMEELTGVSCESRQKPAGKGRIAAILCSAAAAVICITAASQKLPDLRKWADNDSSGVLVSIETEPASETVADASVTEAAAKASAVRTSSPARTTTAAPVTSVSAVTAAVTVPAAVHTETTVKPAETSPAAPISSDVQTAPPETAPGWSASR